MKRSKLFTLLFITILFAQKTIAQDKEVSSISSLFDIFVKISDNIDKLINKEEAKRLNRHLDYFRLDMKKYLVIRKEITSYLETRNYSSFDTLKVQDAVLNLQLQIVKLAKRVETIQEYAANTLLKGADDQIYEIENITQGQRQQYVNKLEALSEGENIDKTQLKKDGATIFNKLQKTIVLIDKIKGQLKTTYNL